MKKVHIDTDMGKIMSMIKPYSESCDQNREVILSVIKPLFSSVSSVLEIGSGTGQHAIYFARGMPHLTWYTSDCAGYHEGIKAWLEEAKINNVVAPIELDVSNSAWPKLEVDAVFTANSLHIMHDMDVDNLFKGAAELLGEKGDLLIYGPFNYHGQFTSESNQRFNQWLQDRDARSGIKDFEVIRALAAKNSMRLVKDYDMPANNRVLHFSKF